jgi:hypothetical protein
VIVTAGRRGRAGVGGLGGVGISGRAGMRFRGRGTWADEVDALQRREAISRTRKHVWASERHRAEPSAGRQQ